MQRLCRFGGEEKGVGRGWGGGGGGSGGGGDVISSVHGPCQSVSGETCKLAQLR